MNPLESFSDYTKITDGNGTEVLYHNGCNDKFAPEILFDVHFGLSNNISIQVYTSGSSSSIKIEYAILRQSLSSGKLTSAATQFFSVLIHFFFLNFFSNFFTSVPKSLVSHCIDFCCTPSSC